MTKNIGNKTLNERATAGGTAAGIVMVILGFRAKRQNISLVINATITATNNPARRDIWSSGMPAHLSSGMGYKQ